VRKWVHKYWSSRCTEWTTYVNASDSSRTIYPCLRQITLVRFSMCVAVWKMRSVACVSLSISDFNGLVWKLHFNKQCVMEISVLLQYQHAGDQGPNIKVTAATRCGWSAVDQTSVLFAKTLRSWAVHERRRFYLKSKQISRPPERDLVGYINVNPPRAGVEAEFVTLLYVKERRQSKNCKTLTYKLRNFIQQLTQCLYRSQT